MKRAIKISLVVATLLAGAVTAYGYFTREEPERVTVIKPSRQTIEDAFTATGAVQASRTVLVVVEPGTRIASLHFREQQHVEAGQLLAKLDETELLAQLSQHRTNLALAESNLAGSTVNVQRLRRLFEKGFAARQEVETAERQIELHQAQIAERRSAIALVEAKLARSSIVSPISGIVTRKLVELGGIVSNPRIPGQAAAPAALAELTELASGEFHADVDQADVAKLRAGLPATLQIDALPERVFRAVTREIAVASTPDPTGRVRYTVKLSADAPTGLLKVGMSGSARFVIARKTKALALPASVILSQGDEQAVYVLEGERAIPRKIKTGLRGEDVVEVASGLDPQDLVIDQGRAKLRPGRRVMIVDVRR